MTFVAVKRLLLCIACAVSLVSCPLGAGQTVVNPILAGFYPDPSICRVGGDYYVVNSSFAYFPGIPVFHSRDLVSWELIGHVLDRPEQLNLDSIGVSRGIFAPSIRYSNGTFYVTCTLVDRGGNFVVTSRSPGGPWSNPVWLPGVNGIDPSLFFDDDGRAYLLYNSIPPDNRPLYDGHRTIRMVDFDPVNCRTSGLERILVNGGTDISKKPVWIEGPHIFRKSGFYYLIAAEGGTGDNHSEVVFRSRSVEGPFVPFDWNPILTQRNLDPRREHPITCTGHADFVEAADGQWWSVFLGCRPYPPYENGLYNTGRETFCAPVRWEAGWPVITREHEQIQYSYPIARGAPRDTTRRAYSGNYSFRDDFSASRPGGDWVFLRTPRESWYSCTERPGYLALKLRPETCSAPVNPTFLGWRQPHANGTVNIALDFRPASGNEKAGVCVFQNEHHFYYLCKSLQENLQAIQLYRSGGSGDDMVLIKSQELGNNPAAQNVYLRVEARGNTYAFLYALGPDDWRLLADGVPAEFLSTKVAGGFVGCMYALYATSLGSATGSTAYVDWFAYEGKDGVDRGSAPDTLRTTEIIRSVAGGVLKEATFRFRDAQTGKAYDAPAGAPAGARLTLESGYNDWRYWNGVILIGMMRAGEVLNDSAYALFSRRDIAFCFDNYKYFQDRYRGEPKYEYPFAQRFKTEELDDSGAMGAALVEVSRSDPRPSYAAYLAETSEYIRTRQARLQDHTLVRPFPAKWTLWADDLYMSASFLSRIGKLPGNESSLDDAALQVMKFHHYLFDESKGLMHHCWYSGPGRPGVAFWGRANGWALLAQVDLLDRLPVSHPLRPALITLLAKHIAGIARYQDGGGLWHQLLDKPGTFLETSCSAMFTYAVARAVNRGYVDRQFASLARRGWEGVISRVRPGGEIDGICAGTGVSEKLEDYEHRPTPMNDPHGIGAVLLAGSEILQLERREK